MTGSRSLGIALATAVLGVSLAGATSAKTLSSAVGVGTNSVQFYTHDRFETFIEKNSHLEIKVYALSLLDLKETPAGIRDGIADMGFVLPPYHPAEYANFNLAADLSMLSTVGKRVESPGAAMAGAIMEYVFFSCPDCLEEFVRGDLAVIAEQYRTDYGVDNTEQKIETVAGLVEKWKRVTAGLANDPERLAKVYWEEFLSGIDPATYGMR